mmetsp:Transcript_12852/g.30497  ORF Transcript_12852/g.30497 Transcript_12852/m.30497 type:complete len:83 (-) Transcript_12852:276-524(-)
MEASHFCRGFGRLMSGYFGPSSVDKTIQRSKKYARRSAIGFLVLTALFLPWVMVYYIGGESLLGNAYRRLDASRLPLQSYGL